MQLTGRDLTICTLLFRFGQLTSAQIASLVFSELSSHTPAARTLARLTDNGFLHRIERRIVGGARGGSGVYVYCLGVRGHKLFSEARYTPTRTVQHHSLAIADCYVMLRRLERAGRLSIRGYATEPDCHVRIDRYELKPDLYVELDRPAVDPIRFMYEIDMGTQGQRQITEKFVRYWGAYNAASEAEWPPNQFVLFVAVDEQRAQELRWLLEKGDPAQQAIFRIKTAGQLEAELS
ncbi:MAG TPA: replication-relaxation family protein [Candidatus Saccharimonadales bacterium]|nr:replication-relaxation family protein [Candidatus Saccharimonadales bacterium]